MISSFAIGKCPWQGPSVMMRASFKAGPLHAAHGREDTASEIVHCCVRFWDEFSRILVEDGNKGERDMARIFQTCMGWAGMYLFYIFYLGGEFNENLPTENLSDDMIAQGMGAIEIAGLSCLEITFGSSDCDSTFDDLRRRFQNITETEIDVLVKASFQYRIHDRRSSLLRNSGRRVSDSMIMADVAPSLSLRSSILISTSEMNKLLE